MDIFQNSNNTSEYPLNTTNTFILEPTLESELKKLLENKNKAKDIKLDKISFLSKNIQSIGNQIPLIFCNITRLYLSNNNITSLEGIEQFANLTHLSISYNLIEDIYELNRIINPEILLFLNVKGNFFCKNPSFVEVILNLFLNLKTLDDLKINNNHKKQIKYGQDLNKLILPFLLDVEEKIEKISTIQNVYQLNHEYNLINSSNNSLQNNNNDKLNNLIYELNNIDENSLSQILSLFNEKKIFNNNNDFIPSINELNNLINNYLNNSMDNNLITSEDNKIKNIYKDLFTSLILNQKRKDYRGFLNYLIMTSEPKLLEFIKNKGNFLKYIEMNKSPFNIICKNFEKILINNSDYTMEDLNEIQMMIFYMYFNGNNILTNNDNDIEIIIDEKNGKEKIVLNNYEKKVINFREITPTYFPIFPLDVEFMKNLINIIKDKLNSLLKNINKIKKISINENNNNNFNNDDKNNKIIYNYQDNVIEQNNENNENINNYEEYNEEDNINNNNEEMINENNFKGDNINNENNKNINANINNNEGNYENNNMENQLNDNYNYNLIQPLIYNSNSKNTLSNSKDINNINNDNSIKNTPNFNKNKKNNNIFNKEEQNKNYNKSLQNKSPPKNYNNTNEQKENNIQIKQNINNFNKTSPQLEPNMTKIQLKYNIIQFDKIISKIIYNHLFQIKYFFFNNNLKKIQYISKIGQIFFTIQTSLYRLQLRYFFMNLKNIKNNTLRLNNNLGFEYFNYPTNKYNYDLKYSNNEINSDNIMNQKALFFYYHNLKKKIFMLFKFNFFCYNKKSNLYILNKNNFSNNNEEETNNNNINSNENNDLEKYLNNENLLNSNAHKFFHGNEDKSNNNNFENIQNYNNSVNMNDINNSQNIINNNIENDNNNIYDKNDANNLNDFNNDKNYNNALKLRKILEEKDEDIKDENIMDKNNDINIKDIKEPKNEVDDLLNNLNRIYKEIDNKCKSNNNSKKMKKNIGNNSGTFNKNKENKNRIKEIREKEREKVKKKYNKNRKLDENKLLGVPNFLKNTFSSLSKNI